VTAIVPIKPLADLQGEEWSSIQAGVRVMDVDGAQDEPLGVLWRTSSDLRDNRPLAHLIRR